MMKVLHCCCFIERDFDILWEVTKVENISHEGRENDGNKSDVKEEIRELSVTGLLNPTTCLQLGDVILFTVDTHHYPQYDL